MHRTARILRTILLVCISLRPATNKNGSPFRAADAFPISTEPLTSDSGAFGLFFPDAAPFAAPFLLYRLKRQGYSDCRVISKADGLHLFARR